MRGERALQASNRAVPPCARHAGKLSRRPLAMRPSILTNVRIHAPFIMEFEWDPAKVIAVVYAMRDARYRVISARRAHEHEEAECRKQIVLEATERSRG